MDSISYVIIYIIILVVVGILTSYAGKINDVVANAVKPSIYPPSGLIGTVWFILFILFGIFLYTTDDTSYQLYGLLFYTLTLLWSPLFVSTKSFAVGFYYLFFIWILTISFLVYTKSILLIPQMIWITFATLLAYLLYIKN
jgi:translocator protein